MSAPTTITFLGPQRFRPTVRNALESLGVEGPVALVTAGWQEREDEDGELREHIGGQPINLQLYQRYEDMLQRDPELSAALRERQDELHELQRLYRLKLSYVLDLARELFRRERPGGRFLDEHRRAAIRLVRTVDRQHLARLRALHDEFDARWRPRERPALERQRRQVIGLLQRSTALAVAGGHVAILLNRLRLFDLPPALGQRPVVAWSAGAMALAERVVLFHDSPPQGRGNPEVLERGLALARSIVALPHARQRLRLQDPVRVSLFARRFAPATCALLDPGARLDWDGEHWTAGAQTRRLAVSGRVRRVAS